MSAPATTPAASPPASTPTPSPPAPAPATSPSPSSPSPPPPTPSPSPPPPPVVTPTASPTNSPSPPPPSSVTPSPPGTPPSPPPPPSVKTSSPPPPSFKTASPPPPSSTKTSSPPPPPSNSTKSSSSSSIPSSAIIGIAVAGVLAVAVIAVCIVCLIKRKPKRRRYDDDYGGPKPDSRRPPMDPYYSSEGPPKPHHRPPTPPHLLAHGYHAPVPPPPISDSYDSNSSGASWRPAPPPPPPHHRPTASHQSLGPKSSFTYDELEEATDGFTRANLLGEGGFGCVYKGKLPGGQLVAVKQLKAGSGQGEREFQAEVEIISRVHHRHLVSLVGYCIFADQRLLVYDYVSNGTLEHHLHGRDRPVLDWPTRLKIAIGASRGLAYLHEDCHPRIIHRDIKASNILLDEHFEAQVSDFGLAKLANDAHTHITTRVMGTFGYLAPEYASTGKLTDKSDVFSFGVVMLELLTGRRPVDTRQPVGEESLVEWSRPLLSKALEDGSYDDFVDPRLADYDELSMSRMVQAAAACVRHSANKRPKMAQVVRALESDGSSTDLFQGVRPGFSSKQSSPYESTEYDPNQYQADMQRFRKMALESGSLYSGTSEYGLNPSGSSSEGPVSAEARQVERVRRGLLGEESSSSEALPLNNINKPLSGR